MKYSNKNNSKGPSSKHISTSSTNISVKSLMADCKNCFGLCCIALYFSASEGFPVDKAPGQPCQYLQADFRCGVHEDLKNRGFTGCIGFDCIGAGQKVAQGTYRGVSWEDNRHSSQMFQVFLIMRQLHELLWYLAESLRLKPAQSIHNLIRSMFGRIEELTHRNADDLMNLDLEPYRSDVNELLISVSRLVQADARRGMKAQKAFPRGADLIGADLRKRDLVGASFRGAYLIAADLRGSNLTGANFIGADFRDADLRGADLFKSIFLIQSQINAAKGDAATRIPESLIRPAHWK
ncbi:pentapeptide repeat-containing protein [Alkaliphilus crotonatoxidans]